MCGTFELHGKLETALARLTGHESVLVFGSGFLANLGILTTLAGPRDAIFADRLNHASLVDGARFSGARLHRFRHGDVEHLSQLLRKESSARRRIVVVESVFSMDGDQAPLESIAAAARNHNAIFIVDEAHAIGVLGPSGGGLCRMLEAELAPDAIVGTLSKSLGSYGGFVACSAPLRELLINRARSFIYSTALPPPSVAAALAAADIIMEDPSLGQRLMTRTRMFAGMLRARGLEVPEAESAVLPILLGDNRHALEVAGKLSERNILAVAVRPPTVPAGTARLRLSVTLAHEPDDLVRAAKAIAEAVHESDSQ